MTIRAPAIEPAPVTGRAPLWQLMLLTAIASAGSYARTALTPLQETMAAALRLSDSQTGLLQGIALALPMAVAALPLGLAIDRRNRVRLLAALTILDTIASFGTAFAPSFAALFTARAVVGFTAFAVNPVIFSLVADFYAPHQRGRAIMLVVIGQYGGMAAAFAIGGWALNSSASGDWRHAMIRLSLPLLPILGLMLALREPPRHERLVDRPTLSALRHEFRSIKAAILPLLVGIVVAEMSIGAAMIWTAPVLARQFDFTPVQIGTAMGAGLLAGGVAGSAFGGWVADVCHRTGGPARTTLALMILVLISAPLSLFPFVGIVVPAVAMMLIYMISILAALVIGTALFSIIVPNELRGLCMAALAAACILIGNGLGPYSVSVLSDQWGGGRALIPALALVCGCASLVSGLSVWIAHRNLQKIVAPSNDSGTLQ